MENLAYLFIVLAIAGIIMLIVWANMDHTNPENPDAGLNGKKIFIGGLFLIAVSLPLMVWSMGWLSWLVTASIIFIATMLAVIFFPKKKRGTPVPPVPPTSSPTGPDPVSQTPPSSPTTPTSRPVPVSQTPQSQRGPGPGRTTFGEDFGDVMKRFAWPLILLALLLITWAMFGDDIKQSIAEWRKPKPAVVVDGTKCPPCPECPKAGESLKEGDTIVTGSTSNKDFDKVSYKKKKSKIGGRRKLSGSEIPIKTGKKDPKNSSCPNGRKMRK